MLGRNCGAMFSESGESVGNDFGTCTLLSLTKTDDEESKSEVIEVELSLFWVTFD